MQIHRLRLQNFRQHEHTELVLGAGLTGIIGPNGAGKTTLLEAIAWAMYGMPAAGRSSSRPGRGRAGILARAASLPRGAPALRGGALPGRRSGAHREQPRR